MEMTIVLPLDSTRAMRAAFFVCLAALPLLAGCSIFQDPLLKNSLLAETQSLNEAGFVENYGTPYRICTYKPTGVRNLLYQRYGQRKQPKGQPALAIAAEGKRRWGYRRVNKSDDDANCWFMAYFNPDGTFRSLSTGESKDGDCAYLGEEPHMGWRKKK